MLYLAQVNQNRSSEGLELQLLAYQQEDQSWGIGDSSLIPIALETVYPQGLLVLVELGFDREVLSIHSARDWILKVIEKYLSSEAISPEFALREKLRIEQWRQEITAQSLELTRRNLEIETRRDQLQELETSLKREKEKLDSRTAQLQKIQAELDTSDNCENSR